MDADRIRDYLTTRGIPFEERPVQGGVQFRCPTGETVTVYDTGKVLVQGKPTLLKAEIAFYVRFHTQFEPPAGAEVTIYTDGACIRNPAGPGGYGVVLLYGGQQKELSKGYRRTTNNRMELRAVIAGLEALKKRARVQLFSDSQYVVRAMTEGWAKRWREKGWRLATGAPAKNPDLWQRLLDLADRYQVQFEWVAGHTGNPWNERCDRLAVAAAKGKDLAIDEGYEK